MGRKCCVPNCCSNYDTAIKRGLPSISTFKFPVDPYLLLSWKKAINRPSWIPSKRSSICINHFAPEDIERYDKPAKLKAGAVPSLFLEPIRSKNNISRKSHKREALHVDKILQADIRDTCIDLGSDFVPNVELPINDSIENFECFKTEVSDKVQNKAWVFACRPNVVHLFSINDVDDRHAIRIDASIKVYNNLRMKIFYDEQEQTVAQLGTENKLFTWSQLNGIIASCTTSSIEDLNTTLSEACLTDEHYETVFLEEHLEETEYDHEARAETTVELTIEKPSPEVNTHFNTIDQLDTEPGASCSQKHKNGKSILKVVQDLQAAKNKCFVCNTEHDTVEELEYHMPTHLNLLPYHCTSCTHEEVIVRTLSLLNKHHLMHQKPINCRFCDKCFTTYGSRRLHEDLKHDKNNVTFRCDVCQKELASKRSLQYHRKHHESPDSLRCKVCLRTLSSAYEVKLHMRTHTGEKPNKCIFCGVSFNRKSNLTEHVRRCHSQERPFVCEVCDKRFGNKLALKKHSILHSSEQRKSAKLTRLPKDFHCKECDKRFETSIQYHSHKRQHVKRYQCSYCGIRIAQLRDFEDHENTHTGSRPYECRSCGKKFKTASTYYGHRLIHSGEKKHFCTICNKGFLRLRHVQVHMRTHTGEKPFRCEFCGRKYADKQTYNRHKLTHRPTVGDMLRAKENNATATNTMQAKLGQPESMQIEETFERTSGETVFESGFVFSTNNFASSTASDLDVISSRISSTVLDSQSSVVLDVVPQGTYVTELSQLSPSDQDASILISADIQNIIIVEQ
ncbi:zinc finger protein 311-like [Anopheles funestus]|uniref:zinc finger protein 311-like n=1 Tax=Anopheles funestus TaxID=62324 RepID=UPI0020C68BE4|nr:zinc finger protein 311-like [Anopheles funestus]